MARPLRIEFPGAVYHVTSRGDRREPIFEDDLDRQALLDVLAAALLRFDAACLAWVFMGNHYHLVLHTREANLSLLMRQVNGVYTQRYNRRHGKVGHLFQGRFKAILVDRDSYLLELCRYVELNPVRAGMVATASDWAWSSYAVLAGVAPCPPWLERDAVWGYMLGRAPNSAHEREQAAFAYMALVAAGEDSGGGEGAQLWAQGLRQQMYLGDDAFVARMQALASDAAVASREVPRTQRARARSLQEWLALEPTRDAAIVKAHSESMLSLSAIARELGLSVSRVSRIVAGRTAPTKEQ